MPDGLLYGVDMSFTSTLFTLGTGFMLVAGRMFEITAAENISISPGSGYARVYVAIDTGGTATENSFDQVSFGVDYAATLDAFAELTQGEININQGAAVYQAEVAVLAINSSGATAIERQMELVSPGAGTGAFAAIAVTYPAGSTVTVTDGKITYTAPNTNGGALFIIPYAATWIVTATDGTETASKSVEITTEGQSVSVELYYTFKVFNPETNTFIDEMALTLGQNGLKDTKLEVGAGFFTLYTNNAAVFTAKKYDLSKFSTLYFDYEDNSNVSSQTFIVGVSETNDNSSSTAYIAKLVRNPTSATSRNRVELDISGLDKTKKYYLGFTKFNIGEALRTVKCYAWGCDE